MTKKSNDKPKRAYNKKDKVHPYWNNIPKIEGFTLDFTPIYGAGYLEIKPQKGAQTTFISCMSGMGDEDPRAEDFGLIFYGGGNGSGKSWCLLADALKYIDDPNFYAVFFRKSVKQMRRSLWREAKKLYLPLLINEEGKFIGKGRIQEQSMVITFPTGATIEFSYLDRDSDAEVNFQGAELSAAYFDEFTHYSEYAYNYIRTRMRSSSKYTSFIRASLNPHPTHFVHKYLDIFIDQETGYPIKEFSARPAYFVVSKGDVVVAWDEETLLSKYPELTPRKYTFVPALIEDNPIMLQINKDYKENLLANDPANVEALLNGNWKYTPKPNGVFSRDYIKPETTILKRDLPANLTYFRGWDKAASKPASEGGNSASKNPDYTASILLAKDARGLVYVMGEYIRDPVTGGQLARYRERVGERDQLILEQCLSDREFFGDSAFCVLPKDLGQAGVYEHQQSTLHLQSNGIRVLPDKCMPTKSKSLRFEPFCTACHNGTVFWVKDSFDQATWDYMILELENFDPVTRNNGFKDDLVDSFSSAWTTAQFKRTYVVPASTEDLVKGGNNLVDLKNSIQRD